MKSQEGLAVNSTGLMKTEDLDSWLAILDGLKKRVRLAAESWEEIRIAGRALGLDIPRARVYGHYRGEFDIAEVEEMELEIEMGVWRQFATKSHLTDMLDGQGRREFEESLKAKEPVRFTKEAVVATYTAISKNRGEIFMRGLMATLKNISWDYKSNQPFKLGSRLVGRMFSVYGGGLQKWLSVSDSSKVDDLNRVFAKVDGKDEPVSLWPELRFSIEKHNVGKRVPCGPYFEIKAHKNGNGHLYFLRRDLVEEVNRLISKMYPNALPGEKPFESEPTRSDPTLKADFFPTPKPVVKQLIEFAEMRKGNKSLEPSAGDGAIVYELSRYGEVTAVEWNEHHLDALRANHATSVLIEDFMWLQPSNGKKYDRVVMNPPFSKGRDMQHVMHAFGFLKQGGRLVSVMSAGVEHIDTKLGRLFRSWAKDRGGEFYPLPAESFKESGTNVNAVIFVVQNLH